jgi:hypothetical protein
MAALAQPKWWEVRDAFDNVDDDGTDTDTDTDDNGAANSERVSGCVNGPIIDWDKQR